MPRTVAHLIFDFLAPDQPEDCRQASLKLLERTLPITGPVIHEGQIVSADDKGVTFDLSRAVTEFATEARDGYAVINVNKIPSDSELSLTWKIPAADTLTAPALPPEQSEV